MTTRLQDVIQPEIFTPYTIQKTMELSALVQSGIIANDAEFDNLAGGANTLINMPFWNDLGNDESQVMKNEGDMDIGKITSSDDVARKHARVNAWGANGLSALLSGDDPMDAIAQLVSAYWARDMQRTLLSTLSGVFKSPTMEKKIHDITGRDGDAGVINMNTFLDATQLMGDAKESPIKDRKSTRLNSSHVAISYAVFCLKKKKTEQLIAEITSPSTYALANDQDRCTQ